jgi:hypothetical protein
MCTLKIYTPIPHIPIHENTIWVILKNVFYINYIHKFIS